MHFNWIALIGNRQQQPIGPAWGAQLGLVVDEITRATGGSGIKKRSRADGVAAEDEEDDRKDSEFGKRCAGEAEVKPRGTKPCIRNTEAEYKRRRNATKKANRRARKREAAAATDTSADDPS